MAAEREKSVTADLTKEQKVFLDSVINLNRQNLEIDFDIDQTLAISEDPVKQKCDEDLGTNYFATKRVDGWDAISRWILEDKVLKPDGTMFTLEEANEYEHRIWNNPEILRKAPPNEALRSLSYQAYLRGVKQSATTVRPPGLRRITYEWMKHYFSWISSGNINFRVGMGETGFEYKMRIVLEKYAGNMGLIHIDDDLKIVRPLAVQAPGLGIIGIKYAGDDVTDLNHAPNRVFLDRDALGSLIPYANVAQS